MEKLFALDPETKWSFDVL